MKTTYFFLSLLHSAFSNEDVINQQSPEIIGAMFRGQAPDNSVEPAYQPYITHFLTSFILARSKFQKKKKKFPSCLSH